VDVQGRRDRIGVGLDDREADYTDVALRRLRFRRGRAWAFLAEASRAFAAAPDYEATLEAVTRLAVPVLGDYCVLDLAAEAEQPPARRVSCGRDPAARKLLGELAAHRMPAGLGRPGAGSPIVLLRPSDAALAQLVGREDASIHWRLGLESCVAVPLRASGQMLGTLLLAATRPQVPHGETGLAVATDFGERAAVAIARARGCRDVRDVNRRKSELLLMVAHELRTPVGCIVTSLEALARVGESGSQARRLQEIVLRQARGLSRIVDDLLDGTWIRTGALAVRRERLDLRAVVGDCLERSRSCERLATRTVSLASGDDPVIVEGDRFRLEQIVGNLLENARKYTPRGGAIRLSVAAEDGQAVIRLEDTGIGIPRDLLARVFEPFVRADSSRSAEGLGLGLALVRGLVRQHGGTVTADSPGPGQGTVVVVRLPLAGPDPAA
jgi:signal transduction histidine kinase